MNTNKKKQSMLKRRHYRVRNKVAGTAERPRLCVTRSLKNISVQVIDDDAGKTLCAASSKDAAIRGDVAYGGNIAAATAVGAAIAKAAQEKSIKSVVFDRGGRQYHGRVKALADAAREGGLVF